MRLYINLVGTPVLLSISQIYYSLADCELRFRCLSGQWYSISNIDGRQVDFILSELFGDGLYDLSDYTTIPFFLCASEV